jgi:hypothetical protein
MTMVLPQSMTFWRSPGGGGSSRFLDQQSRLRFRQRSPAEGEPGHAGLRVQGSDATVNGEHVAFNKDPATDHHKASAAGWLDTILTQDGYKTISRPDRKPSPDSAMVTVWENGKLLVDDNFEDIRTRPARSVQSR